MRRRALPQPSSLTSLLDVLFILVFASLVAAARPRGGDAAPAAAPAAATTMSTMSTATPDAGVAAPDAAATPPAPPELDDAPALRAAALATLAAEAAGRPVIVARIAGDALVAVERDGARIELGVPLVEKVPEPDVAIAYLGDRSAELRVCRVVALRLGLPDLKDHLVVITPDRALGELTVALVAGLRRDAARCLTEQGGTAVVIDPAALEPPAPAPAQGDVP